MLPFLQGSKELRAGSVKSPGPWNSTDDNFCCFSCYNSCFLVAPSSSSSSSSCLLLLLLHVRVRFQVR